MRAVQEREENVLRRYKVTPITPVPLLAASMITGVLLYLPSVDSDSFPGPPVLRDGRARAARARSSSSFASARSPFRSFGLIIAAVVNSSQESNILIQPIYMAMLFLSGATIPLTFMPHWLQNRHAVHSRDLSGDRHRRHHAARRIACSQIGSRSWRSLLPPRSRPFIATKLFRWEKEEKLRASAKLWVLVVLLPFLFLGAYQAWSQHDLIKARILARDLRRGQTWLIQNARIFVGNGKVIESGAVLVKGGKIAEVYDGSFPDAKTLNAEPIDAAGKTVLPGLIDMHVHLGGSGRFLRRLVEVRSEQGLRARLGSLSLLRRHRGSQRRRQAG